LDLRFLNYIPIQVNGSVLPASVISLYCTYLCYSALASEPRDYECNGLHKHSKAVSTGTLTLGLLTTVLSVVYSAVRAGSSAAVLSPPSSPRAGKYYLNSMFLFHRCFKFSQLKKLATKYLILKSKNGLLTLKLNLMLEFGAMKGNNNLSCYLIIIELQNFVTCKY